MTNDEQRTWGDSMADAYERWLVPAVFAPFARDLADRVATHAPRRVLELAAGTGVLTRELTSRLPTADVLATDLNQAMVDVGLRQVPGVDWRAVDAMALPFTAEFDVVVCQFGVMFFPDKPAAFAEAKRSLRPGGALLFSTWATVDTHDFQSALVAGLERAFPDDPPTFMVSVPHGYADPAAVTTDLRAAGFSQVAEPRTVVLEGRSRSAADLAAGFCVGTPIRSEVEARGDIAATIAIVTEEMQARLGDGEIRGRMAANVFEAIQAR